MTDQGASIVEARDLWFRYEGGDWALHGVDLSIKPGEFLAILGQNGAGKTTLVKHFNAILMPAKGEVLVQGRHTKDIPFAEVASTVGYAYQNPDHQIFNMTVREELEFGLRHLGRPEEEIKDRVEKVIETVGLTGLEEEYPFALSRGQRQKLAVGSIQAMDPPVMIIDEPTTGLDWRGGIAMMELIRELHEQDHTIVMITHDMRIVAQYAQRVVVMARGEVLGSGTPKEIFAQSEMLEEAFLRAPQITRITQALSDHGIPSGILTVDEAVEVIGNLVAEGKIHVDAV